MRGAIPLLPLYVLMTLFYVFPLRNASPLFISRQLPILPYARSTQMIHQGDVAASQFREAAVMVTRWSVGRKTCRLFQGQRVAGGKLSAPSDVYGARATKRSPRRVLSGSWTLGSE